MAFKVLLWAAGTLLLAWSTCKFEHMYLICSEPVPKKIMLNGKLQEFNTDGCFTLHELYGAHTIRVEYKNGVEIMVEVYPRLSDDNSSSLVISPQRVVSHGDLKYKVLE